MSVYVRLSNLSHLDDNNSLLHNIIDASFHQLHQSLHTSIRRRFNFDGTAPNTTNSLAYKIYIHLCSVSREIEGETLNKKISYRFQPPSQYNNNIYSFNSGNT